MADGNRFFFPATRLVLAALAAGVLAGAVAVYVSESGYGNKAPDKVAATGSKDDVACEAKAERARQVAAKAVGQVAALQPADPPQSLKGLAFNGPDGKPMTIADHAGKTVLLNLWATWCAPCRAEMPALDALQKEKGSNAFEVVAVNVDTGDDAKPKKFLKDIGVEKLGYYRDPTIGLFNEVKTRGLALGLPVTMLIDSEGCLIAHMNGPAGWSSPDAKRLVEAALTPSG
ncbi:thiol:disulfide interchange protein TlpA [Mesorhizobium sp. B1-1-8]|uniref:thiol:disulfide interchange protein TlpA n=1 Tax=Mesorhizobium sp. B1-1-8 TaxID=2589976 RepID=UPI00112CB642|nr:TlpA disulfide reductase family protein [Mesorhizobium sp. B1-1-8]UCI08843.1 TlpA family protein disulfide reductase [Mesorhizobium sp. B1-1-8]